MIKQLKFYDNEKPISSIKASDDGKIVLISSCESEFIYVMSQEAKTEYDVFGKIKANGYILSIGYYMHIDKLTALAVLSNNLVECYELPTAVQENRLEALPPSLV